MRAHEPSWNALVWGYYGHHLSQNWQNVLKLTQTFKPKKITNSTPEMKSEPMHVVKFYLLNWSPLLESRSQTVQDSVENISILLYYNNLQACPTFSTFWYSEKHPERPSNTALFARRRKNQWLLKTLGAKRAHRPHNIRDKLIWLLFEPSVIWAHVTCLFAATPDI